MGDSHNFLLRTRHRYDVERKVHTILTGGDVYLYVEQDGRRGAAAGAGGPCPYGSFWMTFVNRWPIYCDTHYTRTYLTCMLPMQQCSNVVCIETNADVNDITLKIRNMILF